MLDWSVLAFRIRLAVELISVTSTIRTGTRGREREASVSEWPATGSLLSLLSLSTVHWQWRRWAARGKATQGKCNRLKPLQSCSC